ncbi:MAG: YfcC family protein [Gemmatimonadota bacterium]
MTSTDSALPSPSAGLRFRFPHPLTLLVACILLAAVLSHVLPAGRFDRRDDPVTGRSVVVGGTYHAVAAHPVGAFESLVAIPRGMADAASVIFYVFLVGGGFAVVERTGALNRIVHWLVQRLERREVLMIPIACLAFGLGGILIQMQEELIAFVPVLLLLTRRLGFNAVTAVAMSLGAAAVGAAFSPVNPFQVVIAQKVADLPAQSALGFRLLILLPAMAIWILGVMRFAVRTRTLPERAEAAEVAALNGRDRIILLVVLLTFAGFIVGARTLGWDFDQFSALFFLMGVVAGVVGGLGIAGTAEGFVEGFRSMAYAALLIGFARGIYVVMNDGQIVDTIVNGLFTPLAHLPVTLSALGMMTMQAAVHFPVPSTSGQAVLTLPVLVPLSDLLGMPRQVTVLTYQYGAGLCELVTPTNGALMAMLAATGVTFGDWLRFLGRVYLPVVALAVVAVIIAVMVGVH